MLKVRPIMHAMLAAAAVVLVSGLTAAHAQASLPAPAGTPILTIEGAISHTNDGDRAVFDRDMLEALGTTSFVTSTPWFSGEVEFEGVPFGRVIEAVGAQGNSVLAVALNDYQTEFELGEFERESAILALKRDGRYMPVSDKGPLFIVYPYDADPALDTQKYYARSVWQLARLIVQ